MLSNANFLILDEPTNHLDIMSKEILEDAINGYEGTVLYVSHDRYFINRTAHRILDLTAHSFVNYIGNYDYYLEKHDTVMAAASHTTSSSAIGNNASGVVCQQTVTKNVESENKADWKAKKEEQARLRKKENDLKKCEEKIASIEERLSAIDTEMSDPEIGTQVLRLQDLSREQISLKEQLEKLYEEWEKLAE